MEFVDYFGMNIPAADIPLLRGVIAGFALAAPIGPVGVMCIRRALIEGRLNAFLAGLGAALADTIFGAVAGLGITVISGFVAAHAAAFALVGGLIVLGLGLVTLYAPAVPVHDMPKLRSVKHDFALAFTTAITNPATMIAAAGVFTAYGPIDPFVKPIDAVALVGGVFAGSAGWWLLLASLAAAFKQRFVNRGLKWLNRISGTMLVVFAAVVLAGVALGE